jgi:hypothetical protein
MEMMEMIDRNYGDDRDEYDEDDGHDKIGDEEDELN